MRPRWASGPLDMNASHTHGHRREEAGGAIWWAMCWGVDTAGKTKGGKRKKREERKKRKESCRWKQRPR